MKIRPAFPEDKPAIIDLLKKSLGESTIPKSERLWSWKHEQNPFGPSYVLMAEENNALIGVRAFMQWEWQWHDEKYKAIRAVDTATHPDHQGKGIFKKLTLQLADTCKQQGIHFIFNTPNDQSRPGYLKMGWVEQGRMPLKLKLLRPFPLFYGWMFKKNNKTGSNQDPSPHQEWNTNVLDLLKHHIQNGPLLATFKTPAYLYWRYANNPLFRYNYFTDYKNYLVISRIKNQSFSKEFRIVDFIELNQHADKLHLGQLIKKEILGFCEVNKIDVISISGQQYQIYKDYLTWMGIIPVKAIGPNMTLKDLNMNERFPELLDVINWGYASGDLELF